MLTILLLGFGACWRPNPLYQADGDGSGGQTESGGAADQTGSAALDTSVDGDGSGVTGDPCEIDNGGCDPEATCSVEDGRIECVCDPADGVFGDGIDCESVALFVRVDVPCIGPKSNNFCDMDVSEGNGVLIGDPEVDYEVTLLVRGVIEQTRYTDGQDGGWFNQDGEPAMNLFNVFELQLPEPDRSYYLNAGGVVPGRCFPLEQELTVMIRGGSFVRLIADPMDGIGLWNKDGSDIPIVIDDVDPAPLPFDGQFIQIDLVSATVP